MRGAVVLGGVVLLSACGRLGFDESEPVVADASSDGAAGPTFEPATGNCADADDGPFTEVARLRSAGSGYGVWAAPPFVLVADTTGGLRSVRFDGAVFTETDRLPALAWTEAVWGDGQYYFAGSPGTGLSVLALSPAGKLTVLAQELDNLEQARRGWSADGLIYVPSGDRGLFAMRYDGVSLTQVGTEAAAMQWGQGAWARRARVFFADADHFRILDFDGQGFTDVITPDTRHANTSRIWSNGSVIYLGHGDGLTAFRLTGTTLDELDTFTTQNSVRDVWSDGQHVFIAAEGSGVFALEFANDRFTLVDQVTVGTALGVFGDGEYIYVNDMENGLFAFRGFRCRSAIP